LLAQWRQRPSALQALRPVVGAVPGHPIILSASAVACIAGLPVELGIRDWLRAHPAQVQAWPREDPAYVTDLDTPDDLQRLGATMPGGDSGNKKAA
jgi:CTP:molybdopterin cytidylyltransferase MocA